MQARGTDVDSLAGGALVLRWHYLSMGCPCPRRFFLQPNFVQRCRAVDFRSSPNSLLANAHAQGRTGKEGRIGSKQCSPSRIAHTNTLSLCAALNPSKHGLAARCHVHPTTTPCTHRLPSWSAYGRNPPASRVPTCDDDDERGLFFLPPDFLAIPYFILDNNGAVWQKPAHSSSNRQCSSTSGWVGWVAV